MIHFHGGPITPLEAARKVWSSRHAMISFAHPDQVALAFEICQSVALDNGAFSAWRSGKKIEWKSYYDWVAEWMRHPGFEFALIPDVIDGNEDANNAQIIQWPFGSIVGVPIWHLHESLDRLEQLVDEFPRIALGSSGEYSQPNSGQWWSRMEEALEVCCDSSGRPRTKLHGLRMMDPTIFSHVPFSSVDSTNVARNIGTDKRWTGRYQPLTKTMRALVLADRIESHAAAARWNGKYKGVKNPDLIG